MTGKRVLLNRDFPSQFSATPSSWQSHAVGTGSETGHGVSNLPSLLPVVLPSLLPTGQAPHPHLLPTGEAFLTHCPLAIPFWSLFHGVALYVMGYPSVSPPVATALASTWGHVDRTGGGLRAAGPPGGGMLDRAGQCGLTIEVCFWGPQVQMEVLGATTTRTFCLDVSFQQQKRSRLYLVLLSLLSSLTLQWIWPNITSAHQPHDTVRVCSDPGANGLLKLTRSFIFLIKN